MCILVSAVDDTEEEVAVVVEVVEVVEVVILLLTILHHTGVNMGDGRLHLIGKRYSNNHHHCVQY
jgi:hypothetical protein